MLRYIKHISLLKIYNALKVLFDYFTSGLLKNKFRHGFPLSISVEPAAVCNLRCPQCPTGTGMAHGGVNFMDITLFKKIIDELSPYLFSVILYFQGEPFLNKDFLEMIKYSSKKKIFTISSTNGHFLTPEMSKKIVEAGLHRLIISLDGADSETYENYRVGGNFEKVIEGIKNIVRVKNDLKSQFPEIRIQFLVSGYNEKQIKTMKDLAKALKVDKLIFKSMQIYDFENASPYITSIKKYSRYKKSASGMYVIKSKLKNKCKRLWTTAVFTADGDVLPCCFDKSANFVLGNIKKNNFKQINNSDAYKNFRNIISTDRKAIEMCRNCTEGLRR